MLHSRGDLLHVHKILSSAFLETTLNILMERTVPSRVDINRNNSNSLQATDIDVCDGGVCLLPKSKGRGEAPREEVFAGQFAAAA